MKYAVVRQFVQHASTHANEIWSSFDTLKDAEAKALSLMIGWGWGENQIAEYCDGDSAIGIFSNQELNAESDNGHFALLNAALSNVSRRGVEWVDVEE